MDFEELTAGNLLFRMLDEEARRRVAALGRIEAFRAGQVIIAQGDSDTDIFLVRKGTVDVQTQQEGFIVELNTLGPGSLFGEVAGVSGVRRTATVTAREQAEVLRFAGKELVEELRRHPTASRLLDAIVLHRAKDTIDKTFGE
ncbi:MAG: cyclic nucleotide-binding domain-containing protein [Myxococcales bacterium]|nr:cyclic nucleotide-binding domain-containing protein [Myxococcales bacterium]